MNQNLSVKLSLPASRSGNIAIRLLDLWGMLGGYHLDNLLKPAFTSFPLRFPGAINVFLCLGWLRRIVHRQLTILELGKVG